LCNKRVPFHRMGDDMGQRISTNYIKVLLEIKADKMERFIQIFRQNNLDIKAKFLDNGHLELKILGQRGQISLCFERKKDRFEFDGSYQIFDGKLADSMRRALKEFKGDAIVHWLYHGFTMIYYYENGTVVKIAEKSQKSERILYKYTNFNGQLEWVWRNRDAEKEIDKIKGQINNLLDLRNTCPDARKIDQRLKELSHQLFILEA